MFLAAHLTEHDNVSSVDGKTFAQHASLSAGIKMTANYQQLKKKPELFVYLFCRNPHDHPPTLRVTILTVVSAEGNKSDKFYGQSQ